jgi:hypothetical protein
LKLEGWSQLLQDAHVLDCHCPRDAKGELQEEARRRLDPARLFHASPTQDGEDAGGCSKHCHYLE